MSRLQVRATQMWLALYLTCYPIANRHFVHLIPLIPKETEVRLHKLLRGIRPNSKSVQLLS